MRHQCPTNDERVSNDQMTNEKGSEAASSFVILHSSFLRHWWGIGGAFVIPSSLVGHWGCIRHSREVPRRAGYSARIRGVPTEPRREARPGRSRLLTAG